MRLYNLLEALYEFTVSWKLVTFCFTFIHMGIISLMSNYMDVLSLIVFENFHTHSHHAIHYFRFENKTGVLENWGWSVTQRVLWRFKQLVENEMILSHLENIERCKWGLNSIETTKHCGHHAVLWKFSFVDIHKE